MSVPAWVTFALCAIAVALHYMTVRDETFLMYAIPGLIMLLVIPLTLSWMSRKTFMEASEFHEGKARLYPVKRIGLDMVGQAVKISGTVKKISFRWLNRPHFQIEDDTGYIRVIMFTSPSEDIRENDTVDVLGMVMKNLFTRKTAVISAISIKKTN